MPHDPEGDDPTTPGPAHGEPVLEVVDVVHGYGRTPALRGATLRVAPGEVVAVTGPSGSGKSTLLHVAAGLLRPATGTVRLLGRDLRRLSEADTTRLRRADVGMVLQHGQLVEDVGVLDNVALPLLLDDHRARDARPAARLWLERCGAGDLLDALPAELSGGQAQRVAVARALVTGPRIVFADEPTGSLDRRGGETLLELLLGVVRETRAALVVVTHDNTVAARADREVGLRDGAVTHDVVLR